MAILTIELLKQLIENVPNNYTLCYKNGTGGEFKAEKIEIDVENECIVLK